MLKATFVVTIFLVALGLGQPAHAYLDPGTGSILIQILLGGFVGAAAILKLYWHNFRSYFSHRKPHAPKAPEAAEGEGGKSE